MINVSTAVATNYNNIDLENSILILGAADTNYKEKKLGNINLNRLSSFEHEHFNHAVEKRSIGYKDNIYTLEYCVECDSYGVDDKKYDYIKNNIVIN